MITVDYYPAGERSPLPNGKETYDFNTFQEFKDWVQSYVCVHCLVEYQELENEEPSTLSHWLEMGCGCEIGIEDPKDMIDWDAKMNLPQRYHDIMAMTPEKYREDISKRLKEAWERYNESSKTS